MRKSAKKFLTALLAVIMIITSVFVWDRTESVYGSNEVKVHFKWEAGTPNIYYWNVGGTTNNPVAWPGVDMEAEGNDWYEYTISDASSANIIFYYNSWQTTDLSRQSGEWWFMNGQWFDSNPEAEVEDTLTVHYKSSWGASYIYYWNTNGQTNNPVSWPGEKMTSEGNSWYSYSLDNTSKANIIFTNGSGKQTGNLYRVAGEWWYYNNTWMSTNPEPESLTGPDDTTPIETETTVPETTVPETTTPVVTGDGIELHFKSTWGGAKVYYWNTDGKSNNPVSWPGVNMTSEGNGWYTYNIADVSSANIIFDYNGNQTGDLSRNSGAWWYKDGKWYTSNPDTEETTTPEETTSIQETTTPEETTEKVAEAGKITVHFKSSWGGAKVYYWNVNGTTNNPVGWPGTDMTKEGSSWYKYTINGTKANIIFNYNGNQTKDLSRTTGEWWYKDGSWYTSNPDGEIETETEPPTEIATGGEEAEFTRTDFRDESIYFVMTTRFYDGDTSNNVHCWDDAQAKNGDDDPAWRGDFKGLIEKLDYIKALGFTAVWITPVVTNTSGYDYHGYHASDFSTVDPRYESADTTYQDLIDAAHAKGMKIIQDVVFNHTGNFGEANLMPMFEKVGDLSCIDCLKVIENCALPADYDLLVPGLQYQARLALMKNTDGVNHDINNIYHHYGNFNWDEYDSQLAQIAGDCVDLNTENPIVYNYLIDCYTKYIDMGVDAFRIDTAKHISRLTFNEVFNDAFKAAGGDDFYMFGEVCARDRNVWYRNLPGLSCPFYTWKDSVDYAWSDTDQAVNVALTEKNFEDNRNVDSQPTSTNAFLQGNNYHATDYSMKSGLDVIDFPMHWNFENASSAFGVAVGGDKYYNDATWNVVYVDSHDYAPDCAPENQRFAGSQETWAENLDLMFTFRGIPCIYYGSEIEFMKGAPIDVGPNAPLATTGRAYFGDYIEGNVDVTDFAEYTNASGTIADTLNHPLSLHIQRLNKIRQSIPALRKGQYSVEGVNGNLAFKRRYTNAAEGIDSFVCVSITNGATFNGIPNGRYVDAITGDVKYVSNGTLSISSMARGDMRVYVLDTALTKAPGKIGVDGKYLN